MDQSIRQKRLQFWQKAIPAVFKAEADIAQVWQPRLAEGKFQDDKYRAEIGTQYVMALAEHIVDSTDGDEQ